MSDVVVSDVRLPSGAAVVVVGGGVTGLSTAWWLARAGVDVLVLEAGIAGFGASGRNGGGCTHVSSPLFREEQRLWPMMDEMLGYPTEFRPHRVQVALSEADLTTLQARAAIAARQGFHSEALDAAQIRDAAPLVGDTAVGGYFTHFGGHANPHRTVQAYAWSIQDHGGHVLQHTPVTGFTRSGGRVSAVVTPRGTVTCDQMVLAAGPHTAVLARLLDVALPAAVARAEMIVTEPLEPMPHGGVDGNGLYGRQTLRGNLAYGGGPHEWFDEHDLPGRQPGATPIARSIARRMAEMLPKAAHARVIRSWAGFIENTPDGRPIIDRLADPPNVVVASMSSVGFGLSPASGHAIAELVMEGRSHVADLSTVSLARFADLDPDWRAVAGWTAVSPI